MDRVIKINSLQGSFNDTKNLIDFVIPRGEVHDLSQSYINMLRMQHRQRPVEMYLIRAASASTTWP